MKFLLVDDHPLFRDALHDVLRGIDDAAVRLDAGDCNEAEDLIRQHDDIDLVLLDLVIPCRYGRGTDFLARLSDEYPELPIVMLSASESPGDMKRALDAGALGYIPKSLPTKVMIGALQLVLAGGIYIPPHLVDGNAMPGRSEAVQGREEDRTFSLTPRQQEVARLLIDGYSNKEIGRTLGLSPETVKVHLSAIFRALGVNNRTRAVMELERRGIGAGADTDRESA